MGDSATKRIGVRTRYLCIREGPDRRDPPAQLKLLAMLDACYREAQALMKAHGLECACGPCYTADGIMWALESAYTCFDSEQVDWYDLRDTEVDKLRKYLTERFGESSDPGTTAELPDEEEDEDEDAGDPVAQPTPAPEMQQPEPDKVITPVPPIRFREWL